MCSYLKPGVSGVLVDYEHIHYAVPPLWNLPFNLYKKFSGNFCLQNSEKGHDVVFV